MAEAAQKCMAALDAGRQDISMLFLLSKWDWLMRFNSGQLLVNWVRGEMKLRGAEVCCPEFHAEVRREFGARLMRPVAPERVVHAVTKDRAKQLAVEAGWPSPFFPVMLQTRPPDGGGFRRKKADPGGEYTPGVFVIYSCWVDAIYGLIVMSGTNQFKHYPAAVVFENQIVDMGPRLLSYPCRIILDCDAKLAEFNHEYTLAELRECIDGVALWFVRQLLLIKAIKPTDRVVANQKNKDRATKASSHLTFNIAGISTHDIREVLERIFGRPRKEEEDRQKQAVKPETDDPQKKKKARLTKKKALPEFWRVTDAAPFHGRAQFSTLLFYDKNKGETRAPIVVRELTFVNGEIVLEHVLDTAGQVELGPTNPDVLNLLNRCCYSSITPDFVTLSADFMVPKQQQTKNRGASAGPSTSSGAPSRGSSPFLPAWLESAISCRYGLNTSMPSLNKMHSSLVEIVPDVKRENTAHVVGALFCPNTLLAPRIHPSNGIYVVVCGETVYARCSDGSCSWSGIPNKAADEDSEQRAEEVEVVAGTGHWRRPWVKYTERSYKKLMATAGRC